MPDKKNLKVLLVDDDEEDYLLTRDALSDVSVRHYTVDWAPHYQAGLAEIRKGGHDVYLVDYRLGIETGLDLIRQAISEGISVPIILLTGQGDSEIDEKAMEAGAADYLVKGSFDGATLDRSIRYSRLQNMVLQEVRNLHEQSEKKVQERTSELARTVDALESANNALIKHINERRLAEEALRESQTLFMTMAKNFPGGMISVLDSNWEYIFNEGRGYKTLGISSETMKGQKFGVNLSPSERDRLAEQIERAFDGEATSFETMAFGRYFLCHVVPLADISDGINKIMIVSQDITERKMAEEETRQALEKERQLNELKSRFVSMASHEFRTPLATILSSVSLISKYNGPDDFEKRLRHINRIKASVQNMTETLNDFLSLDKLDEGMVANLPQAFNLPELFEDLKDEMYASAKDGQEIRTIYEGDMRSVVLDKQLLRNITINLLSNAIKYSPEHSTITLTVRVEAELLAISVGDTGIGIPPEDQQHIFNTFFRAHNAVNIQGTGLGLNIVKKYLDLMRGTINFFSEEGKGTTFTVSIPLI